MKKLSLIIAATALVPAIALASSVKLDTQAQKLSYTFGARFGMDLAKQKLGLDLNALEAGVKAGYTGKNLAMTSSEMKATSKAFLSKRLKTLEQKAQSTAKTNEAAGKKFLAANAKKTGVKSMKDGLQYKVIKAGTGATPTKTSTVTVNYEGKLISGKVFDSSYKRGKPTTFPVSGVIKGWQQALTHMKVGSTWMVYVPAKLAYQGHGVPGAIPPGSTLIFKIQLLSSK